MTRDEKSAAIADLKDRFENSSFFLFHRFVRIDSGASKQVKRTLFQE
jgi:ribosomal protein L10